jgi:hypothetical protein
MFGVGAIVTHGVGRADGIAKILTMKFGRVKMDIFQTGMLLYFVFHGESSI